MARVIPTRLLVAGLVTIAAALGVAWWVQTHERVRREVSGPMQGEARYNAWYALGQALRETGIAVRPRAVLEVGALGPRDRLVLGTDVRTLSDAQVQALIDFVHTGGGLLFEVPSGATGRDGRLMERLKLERREDWSCFRWLAAGSSSPREACGPVFERRSKVAPHFAWRSGQGELLARVPRGDGWWLAMSQLSFMANPALDEPGHAALAWQLLSLPAGFDGTVHLVYSADMPPWYVLLLRQGWMVALPLFAALALWLWARGGRLGPLLPPLPVDRRALLEHVRATGEFAFRRGRGDALHDAIRRRYLERLRRVDPALAALPPDDLARIAAARYGLPAADIRHALAPRGLDRAAAFLAAIRTLTELERRT